MMENVRVTRSDAGRSFVKVRLRGSVPTWAVDHHLKSPDTTVRRQIHLATGCDLQALPLQDRREGHHRVRQIQIQCDYDRSICPEDTFGDPFQENKRFREARTR